MVSAPVLVVRNYRDGVTMILLHDLTAAFLKLPSW